MCQSFTLLAILLVCTVSKVLTYKLSPDDGQADIGAYHVQPGRCAGVERQLGRTRYDYFFRQSPFQTTFSSILPADNGITSSPSPSSSSPPPTPGPDAADAAAAGSGVEQLDATSLCAFNPALTEGYGGGFDKMKLYLVYSRCIYGTNEMRVLCGQTDANGKPTRILNVVQASCPQGTKCKNLCATMKDPSLTSPYAAKQVQLAQCMEVGMWDKLTSMYRPKSQPAGGGQQQVLAPAAADGKGGEGNEAGKIDPKVVDKSPANPTQDPTHTDKDGTIPGKILTPATSNQQPPSPAPQPQPQAKGTDVPAHVVKPRPGQPETKPVPGTTGHLQLSPGGSGGGSGSGMVVLKPGKGTSVARLGEFQALNAGKPQPAKPIPAAPPATGQQQQGEQKHPLEHQKALSIMGFRKRGLGSTPSVLIFFCSPPSLTTRC